MPFSSLDVGDIATLLRDTNDNTFPNAFNPTYFHELPFYRCNNYSIINECMSSDKKFFHAFENNHFSNNIKFPKGMTMDNFSCKYYNEDKFNTMVSTVNQNALKVFHLNIRSLNKYCYILKSQLSCLKCEFELILLTEIGKADKEIAEKVFDKYNVYMDLPVSRNGGAAILVLKEKFTDIEYNLDVFKSNCNCTGCLVETVFIKLKSNITNIQVGCIYRLPNGNTNYY